MLLEREIHGNPTIAPQCDRCEHNPANYPDYGTAHADHDTGHYDEHNDFAFHADRVERDADRAARLMIHRVDPAHDEPTDAGPYIPPSEDDRDWWAAYTAETRQSIGVVGVNRIERLSPEARRRIEDAIRWEAYMEADRERQYRQRLEEEEMEGREMATTKAAGVAVEGVTL